jgi:hypothetical protein
VGARRPAGEFVVTLPGEKKLRTVASLLVGDRATSVSAFVVRNPDENHEAFYRYLLRHNLRMPGLAYAIDTSGDVYVKGEVPTTAVDAAYLDQLFGVVLDAADSPFNDLLVLASSGRCARSGRGAFREASRPATWRRSGTSWRIRPANRVAP